MSADFTWRFCPDPFDEGAAAGWAAPDFDDSGWNPVTLPTVFDRCGPGLAGYEGKGWFRGRALVTLLSPFPVLTFGAVNYRAQVWLNGILVGENPDPFLPFTLPVKDALRPDMENTLAVCVDNTRRDGDVPGLQRGWRPYGGILRPVALVGRNAVHFESVTVDGAADGTVTVLARIANRTDREVAVRLLAVVAVPEETDTRHWALPEDDGVLPAGATLARTLTDRFAAPDLWSPETPARFQATVTLSDAEQGTLLDSRTVDFGFRTVSIDGGRILLNGRPIFLRGFNRHEDSPTHDARVDPATAEADLRAMKVAGANFVRLCHYPHDPSTLTLCDALGLLAMAEIPLYWWGDRPEDHDVKLATARRQLECLIERDRSHPSVIFWSVSNETSESDPVVAAGNQELVRLAKRLDPTRLAVHVSHTWQQHPSFEGDDVLCVNGYPTWFPRPDGAPGYRWRDELAILAARYPGKPILVAEFGHPAIERVASGQVAEGRQSDAIQAQFDDLTGALQVCGATLWCWADHAWPEDRWLANLTTSPFGVVTRARTPKRALETVTSLFALRRPQLHMRRATLDHLPPRPAPPPGYTLRAATAEDAGALAHCLGAAFPEMTWTPDNAYGCLLDDPSVQTTFVIVHDETGAIAATASARLLPDAYPGTGYVHWVGGDPQHRGKRLGSLVSLAVLHEFVRLGCTAAVLDTDDFRVPAITVYRDLGFVPQMRHATHPERWSRLDVRIGGA